MPFTPGAKAKLSVVDPLLVDTKPVEAVTPPMALAVQETPETEPATPDP
jgi:hypothetical protein